MFRLFLREKIKSAEAKASKSSKDSNTRKNRRAHSRFPVDHKHLTVMNEQDILVIREISAKGFSSKVSERTFERLNVGDVFSARIRYLGEIFDLHAKVSWKSGDNIGFELEKAERRAIDFMQRIIQPMALAASLQKVETSFMKENLEGKTWYHGEDDIDVYLWRDHVGEITAWQLICSERFFDWNSSQGSRTGKLVIEEETVKGALDVTKKSLKQLVDTTPDLKTKQFAIDVLMASEIHEKNELITLIAG